MTESKLWSAWPGQQTAFLSSPAFEAFYGGQAGPGKTECMVMDALRQISHPKYTSRFFRRLFPSLEGANGPIQRSMEWYPAYGGVYNGSKHMWRFPSGARIYFSAMQYIDDMYQFQGDELTTAYFDELPEFEPKQYLFIFTRVRAAAPGLFPYVRGAGNPGGVGRAFVRQRFIKQDIRNKLGYFLQTEDGDTRVTRDTPGALSRAFYPATLADNPAADPDYASRILATGDPVLIAQLLYGDFDAEYSEGRIYDNWSLDNITGDAAYRPDRPVYWGVDDGYVEGQGRGTASYHPRVILFAQDNDIGGVDIFDEYVATGETYGETLNAVLLPPGGTPVTRWQAYRKPDMAWVDGSAAMLRAELGKRDVTTANGTHRVTEGIKNVRRLIRDGNGVILLRVHPLCTNLVYEMSSYRSDPKARSDSGELLPLKSDDHSCLVASTLVTTLRGDIPIRDVVVGDYALTRKGWRKVIAAEQTEMLASVMTVSLSNGIELIGTGNHPVFVDGRGFSRLDTLRYGDIIVSIPNKEKTQWQELKKLFTRVLFSDDTQSRRAVPTGITSSPIAPTSCEASNRFTARYGRMLTGLSPTATRYITATKTRLTTISTTLNACLSRITNAFTLSISARSAVRVCANGLTLFDRSPSLGISRQRVGRGTASTVKRVGLTGSLLRLIVISAAQSMRRLSQHIAAFAQTVVSRPIDAIAALTTKCGFVSGAGLSLPVAATTKPASVPVYVLHISEREEKQPVYNLTVEDAHEYFANGVLVSNCDSLRYAVWHKRWEGS